MAEQYSDHEWAIINDLLESNPALFGLPERREKSIIMASWNIRKFGKEDGHSEHARKFYARFAQNCDFIAVQEIMTDMFSMRDLCRRMNELVPDADYKILASDVTGKAPGKLVMPNVLASSMTGVKLNIPNLRPIFHSTVLKLSKTSTNPLPSCAIRSLRKPQGMALWPKPNQSSVSFWISQVLNLRK